VRRAAVVLFDLGGVLLPFDPRRRVRAVADALAVDEAQARAALAIDLFVRMDLGEATALDFATRFSKASGRDVGEDEARQLILSVFEAPNDELWALAHQLKDRVVVGGFSDNPAFVRGVFPAGAALNPMFWSSELGATKGSEAAFAAVEARLGAPADAILLVDDSLANVVLARRRGWDAVRFTHNVGLRAEFAQRGLT